MAPADAASAPCGASLLGPGRLEDDAAAAAGLLAAACRSLREGGSGSVALDLGSPPPLTPRMRSTRWCGWRRSRRRPSRW